MVGYRISSGVGVTALVDFQHESVLLQETVDAVRPMEGGRYVDCTLGGGGHTAKLLERSAPSGRVIAIDQDLSAIEHARHIFRGWGDRLVLVHSNFREIRRIVREHGFLPVDGVVFDLGVSSPQLDVGERGFSYRHDARLDMRMDPSQPLTAEHVVNNASEAELARIFFEYGEEKFSRRIARQIVERRSREPIVSTQDLAELVKSAIPAPARRTGGHPARRVFQALRIHVNDELGALEEALAGAFEVLRPDGRMAVITFHSLEDRIVKQAFATWSQGCVCPPDFPVCRCGRVPQADVVTRKPVVPGESELAHNPRARSAKLRVLQKRSAT